MTEDDWLNCTTPGEMLAWLHGRVADRKLRLFACACCRSRWDELTDPRSRDAVLAAEAYAERQLPVKQMKAAGEAAQKAARGARSTLAEAAALAAGPLDVARLKVIAAACAQADSADTAAAADEWVRRRKQQCDLLRDLVGNPFRPAAFDPAWLDPAATTLLAHRIYDDRRFDELPRLADALAEAGCDNEDLLAHCRAGGEHARGCWALDLLLGKG